jgi:hypothetical protein
LEYIKELESKLPMETQVPKHSFGLGAPDKLVYAVLGDMYKHLSLEMGDSVSDYVNDLEGFIRSILEVREEQGIESYETLKSVVIKPNSEKTYEVLNKLKNPFLDKVKAENMEVVEPGEEWEGIKLHMEMDNEIIAATFKAQSTKIKMLLKLQSPQKIRKIMEEKGEYTLGVEGYPVTISPRMLTFKEITPDNFEIREVDGGWVYIGREVIDHIEEEDLPPPPPDYEEEYVDLDEQPEQSIIDEPQENQIIEEKVKEEIIKEKEPQESEMEEPKISSPQRFKRKKRTAKKKGIIGKIKKRLIK